MNQKGFTLIELIVIIVILGILAVTAIPRYVDMRTDAEEAAADGVYGAAQGATSMNFAANLLNPGSLSPITGGATLVGALEEMPEGWEIVSDALVNTPYSITVQSPETATAKAVLTRTW